MQPLPRSEDGTYRLPLGYEGVVRLDLPPLVRVDELKVSLELAPSVGAPATRTYQSQSTVPADLLVVTDRGNGEYDVEIPADDGVNGPIALMTFWGLAAGADADVVPLEPVTYHFQATGSFPTFMGSLRPQLVVEARMPSTGPGATVPAGSTLAMTVPADSQLRALGLGDPTLPFQWGSVRELDGEGNPTGPIAWVPDVDATGDGVTVTVPQTAAAGRYGFTLSLGVAAPDAPDVAAALSVTVVPFEVTPALNPGLRSNTGWDQTDAGVSPLVGIGAGMVLAAGVITVAALRPKRRAE
ncbi:MAG TPA: hypothetical protein VHF92_06315 [Geodermatophilus sp.]|nr:hypothetical protein [Geodermatophilus sp.]